MVMYWCGVTSIAHLTVISVERCATIVSLHWSLEHRARLPPYIIFLIIFSWIYGIICATLPLAGL